MLDLNPYHHQPPASPPPFQTSFQKEMKTIWPGQGRDPLDHLALPTTQQKTFSYKKLPKYSSQSYLESPKQRRFHLSSWDVTPPRSLQHLPARQPSPLDFPFENFFIFNLQSPSLPCLRAFMSYTN